MPWRRFAPANARAEPTLGFTHFQPAQLTTWANAPASGATTWSWTCTSSSIAGTLRFRGAKGTTGTQASFLALFHGDHDKVRRLDQLVAQKMGFDDVYPVTGQTYSRKIDSQVLDVLSGVGQSAHKFGTDLRLLAHARRSMSHSRRNRSARRQWPYKRNPMRAERMAAWPASCPRV